jgi:hypothetical protein
VPRQLSLSRSEIDRIAGLPVGYSGKLLGSGRLKDPKRMWPVSLEAMLGVLGLKILLIEDEAAPVDRAQQRFGNVSRLTPKLLPPPTLNIVSGGQKRPGKYG